MNINDGNNFNYIAPKEDNLKLIQWDNIQNDIKRKLKDMRKWNDKFIRHKVIRY